MFYSLCVSWNRPRRRHRVYHSGIHDTHEALRFHLLITFWLGRKTRGQEREETGEEDRRMRLVRPTNLNSYLPHPPVLPRRTENKRTDRQRSNWDMRRAEQNDKEGRN